MIKRTLSLLLVLSFIFIFVIPSLADNRNIVVQENKGDYSYILYSDGTLYVSGTGTVFEATHGYQYLEEVKQSYIPIKNWIYFDFDCEPYVETTKGKVDEMWGLKFDYDGKFHAPYEYDWNGYEDYIKNIVIGKGITQIGKGAFARCSNLESIHIPESLSYIGEFAFVKSYPSAYYVDNLESFSNIKWDDGKRQAYYPPWIMPDTPEVLYEPYWFVNCLNIKNGLKSTGYFDLYEKNNLVTEISDELYNSSIALKYCRSIYRFKDIKDEKSWYYDDVNKAAENGWMNGTGTRIFNPNGPFTRAMMAEVLYRIDGTYHCATGNIYADVPAGKWYSDAVEWANTEKIMIGIPTGWDDYFFAPDYPITREEAATVLIRYLKTKKLPLEPGKDISYFPDYTEASDFAAESLSLAFSNRIIYGTQKENITYLSPKDILTRAQAACLLVRCNF